jgi:DNA-binding transcriptional MocR family regulator
VEVLLIQKKILITNGCQEALSIALQSVAKSGDIIAIESPTFYGLLQAIESLGMQALEIPTDPQHGISLAALELALDQ